MTLIAKKIGFLIIGVLSFTLISCASPAPFKESKTLNVPHIDNKPLQVNSTNGYIVASTSDDKNVQIVAHINATSTERLKATQILATRNADNALEIKIDWPENQRKPGEGCSFEIKLPNAKGISLHSSNGRLVLDSFAGEADLKTSNGHVVVVNHDGELVVNTSNGSVNVNDVKGKIKINTSNGNVTTTNATEGIKIKTSNGSVNLKLDDNSSGSFDVETSNGNVTLKIGSTYEGNVKMTTSNGRIYVDNVPGFKLDQTSQLSKHKAHLKVGDSSKSSRIKTSNGSIRVHNSQ